MSASMIISEPPQADVILNGRLVGKTPYKLKRTMSNTASIYVRLVHPLHEQKDTVIVKDGDLHKLNHYLGYLFIFPFDFDRNFKDEYFFVLQPKKEPVSSSSDLEKIIRAYGDDVSKATKLKVLLDEYKSGKISRKEFEALKKEILKKS